MDARSDSLISPSSGMLIPKSIRPWAVSPSAGSSDTSSQVACASGVNNRTTRSSYPTVVQDFGFSADTNFAGKDKGEIGGVVHRSSTPALYAMPIHPITLDQPFSALLMLFFVLLGCAVLVRGALGLL